MKEITINNNNQTQEEFQKKQIKSRALLTNTKGEILIAKYGDVFLLPGGGVEDGETPEITICRELREEVGVEFELEQLQPFAKIRYFQPGYPNRNGSREDRILVTYYYIGEIEKISAERCLTDKEIRDGFDVQFYSLEQISEIIKNSNSKNPRREYFNKELIEIINYYKQNIKQKDRIIDEER